MHCSEASHVPRPDIGCDAAFIGLLPSLDYLVGAQQNRWGYGKTERLGGLEVHDHFELGRKLHRKIARLLAAQDAIDIGRGATPVVYWSTP